MLHQKIIFFPSGLPVSHCPETVSYTHLDVYKRQGLVHVNSLDDDYYIFHEDAYELVGEHTGKAYKLGQQVRIRVAGADELARTIDFELAEQGER